MGIVALSIGGMKFIPEAGQVLKLLSNQFDATVNPGKTLHNADDNTDYQVTAGKTFTILGFIAKSNFTSILCTLYQSDAADTSTNPIDKIVFRTLDTGEQKWTMIPTPNLPTIAAEKYVNVKVSSSSNAGNIDWVYGYES